MDKFEACIPHEETFIVSQQNDQEETTEDQILMIIN